MNFVFLSLLALTASALESPFTKFMGDPQLFVSAFENADKDTIKKMVSMVNDLLKEGEADRVAAVAAYDAAKEQNDRDKEALGDATAQYNTAASALSKAVAKRDSLAAQKTAHYWVLYGAQQALRLANQHHAAGVKYYDDTKQRVAEEKQALEDAKSLLRETKADGRRLLSATEADPKAVDHVIKEIDALIAAGEKEEADALAHLNKVTAAKTKAENDEKVAQAQYTNTVNAFNAAVALVEKNTAIFNEKKRVLGQAIAAEKKSAATLRAATTWRNIEVNRVAEEKKTLLEVKELLEKML